MPILEYLRSLRPDFAVVQAFDALSARYPNETMRVIRVLFTDCSFSIAETTTAGAQLIKFPAPKWNGLKLSCYPRYSRTPTGRMRRKASPADRLTHVKKRFAYKNYISFIDKKLASLTSPA